MDTVEWLSLISLTAAVVFPHSQLVFCRISLSSKNSEGQEKSNTNIMWNRFRCSERWYSVPPIRAESVLMALTKGWPEPAEPDWSTAQRETGRRNWIRDGGENGKKKMQRAGEGMSTGMTEKHKWCVRIKKDEERKIRQHHSRRGIQEGRTWGWMKTRAEERSSPVFPN